MSKATCGKCGSSDFTPGGNCRPCKKASNAAYRAKASKASGGGSVKARSTTAAASKSSPKIELKLEIPAGFGFVAEVTADGFLQIQQANQDGDLTDTLVLTKAETRRLFQEFQQWAAS